MKIAILGAGAMGGIFGGGLAASGASVVLVDNSRPLVERLQERGLVLVTDDGERTLTVDASDDPAALGVVDAMIVFVKCYHSQAALEFAAPMIGPDTIVATLQNGWGNGEVIAGHVPADRVVIGINYHSGTVLEPGRVAHTNTGPTKIGPLTGTDTSAAERLAEPLRAAGFEVEVTADIRRQVWRKLTLNSAALPVAALTRLHAGAMADGPAFQVVEQLARETVTVGHAMGFELDPGAEVDYVRSILIGAGDGKASMLQDVEAGRRTEIEVVNGAVASIAASLGMEAPLNHAMADLVRAYEQAHPPR
jgi:2-dehydropantoate 2-reductase